MESLARLGIRTILFVEPPGPEQLRRFEGVQAVGMAGVSRSLPTEEMDAELLPAFKRLRELNAPVFHYKVCSTFDSSPEIGSIGHAIDLGQELFASPFVPLLVGVPQLWRYCVFGNLFARSGPESEVFRLDRHPTMRQHPTTPMAESDLRLHLSRQTAKKIGLFDILQVAAPKDEVEERLEELLECGSEIVLFDVLYEEHLPTIGRLIWEQAERGDAPLFVAGSSGVGYALTAHWDITDLLPGSELPSTVGEVEQLVAISGSCSPVTARQICSALEHGFAEIALEPARLINPEAAEGEIEAAVEDALDLLGTGRSLILHTCRGPDDPRIEATVQGLAAVKPDVSGPRRGSAKILGEALGRILRRILEKTDIRRAAIAGGDTSGYATRSLGIEALEVKAPFAPAMPVSRVHASGTSLDGLEFVFKGGQTGKVDFFEAVRRGKP
jgi:3-oxoisoapionate kinase